MRSYWSLLVGGFWLQFCAYQEHGMKGLPWGTSSEPQLPKTLPQSPAEQGHWSTSMTCLPSTTAECSNTVQVHSQFVHTHVQTRVLKTTNTCTSLKTSSLYSTQGLCVTPGEHLHYYKVIFGDQSLAVPWCLHILRVESRLAKILASQCWFLIRLTLGSFKK